MRVMRQRIFSATFLFLAAFGPQAQAQAPLDAPHGFPETPLRDLLIRQWTLDDGLPTETLTDLVQTQDGFLWISTFQGLVRFDGREFEIFDKQAINAARGAGGALSLQSESFISLEEDDDGVLWVASQAGEVLRVLDGSFQIYPTPVEGDIREIWIDSQEDLWIGAQSLVRGDPRSSFEEIELPGLGRLGVDVLLRLHDILWIGSDTHGLIELRDDGLSRNYRESDGLESNSVNSLAPACDGGLWIGHWGGLSKMAPAPSFEAPYDSDSISSTRFIAFPEMRGISIHKLLLDAQCDLWLGTSVGLGRRSADGKFEWLDPQFGGPEEVYSLEFDQEGNLWVAGVSGGLFRLKQSVFGGVTSTDGLPAGTVEAFVETQEGRILASAGQGELWDVTDDPIRSAASFPEFENSRPSVLYEDSRGDLWVGTYQGLLRIGENDRTFYSRRSGFFSSQIRALQEADDGAIWIGTGNQGVLILHPDGAQTVLDHEVGLISNFVFAIDPDRSGNLLIAMRGGFHVVTPSGGITASYRGGKDFPGGNVFSVYQDEQEDLWLSTDAGLIRGRRGEFHVLDRAQGFPVNKLFDYVEDDYGQAWMCSGRGILRVEKDALNRFLDAGAASQPAPAVDVFDQEDGMTHRQCTGARRILKTRDGDLYFPTYEGVTRIDPGEMQVKDYEPPVAVKSFQIDGVPIVVPRDDPQRISISPGPHRYSFQFAVLGFRDPAKNRARYRLLGYDESWKEAEEGFSATYTNLAHGRYVFEVMGAVGNGGTAVRDWGSQKARIVFRVRPFYYETFLFRAGSAILIGVLLLGIYRWRLRAIHARHREVEAVSEERRRLLGKLQERNDEIDRYLYLFAHDLKNPLVTIRSFAGMTRKEIDDGKLEKAERAIERVYEAADQMNQQLDDLLMLAEIGRTQVTTSIIDLNALARISIQEQSEKLKQYGAEVKIVEDLPEAVGVRRQIGEIFDELIENAIKFSGDAAPRIEIGGNWEDFEVHCWVRDQGVGIAPQYHEKVFHLLHQLDRKSPGTGVGLALVQRVVEEHCGRVWIESPGIGRGTTVHFTLPAKVQTGPIDGGSC